MNGLNEENERHPIGDTVKQPVDNIKTDAAAEFQKAIEALEKHMAEMSKKAGP